MVEDNNRNGNTGNVENVDIDAQVRSEFYLKDEFCQRELTMQRFVHSSVYVGGTNKSCVASNV